MPFFFYLFGVQIMGVIHYFQYPNSFNKKFSELNNNDGIIIHDCWLLIKFMNECTKERLKDAEDVQ